MPPNAAPGHWLCPDDDYGLVANELCQTDPRLKERNRPCCKREMPLHSDLPEDAPRVVIFRQENDGSFIREATLSEPGDLDAHLQSRNAAGGAGNRLLYLVESRHPKIIHLLGTYFNIHPAFFAGHQRASRFRYHRRQGGGNDMILQPTLARNNSYAMLWYHEALYFDPQPPGFDAFCGRTSRSILFSSSDPATPDKEGVGRLGRVRRKCSIWSRTNEGESWDCKYSSKELGRRLIWQIGVILCDPPVKWILHHEKEHMSEERRVKTSPYQGGYVDFRSLEDQMEDRSAPSRASLLDDLCFYLEKNCYEVQNTSRPILPLIIAQKIVVSHYVKLIHYMSAVLCGRHHKTLSYEDKLPLRTKEIRRQWADVQRWERHAFEYCEDLENNLITLGIAFQNPDTSKPFTLEEGCAIDFRGAFRHLTRHYERIQKLNASMTGLAQIAGNEQSSIIARRSVREAKTVKALAIVGLIFIPLGYISTLFSMEGEYAPGGENFRQTWAVALPLVAIVVLSYYVLDLGYDFDGDWSWKTFRGNIPFVKRIYAWFRPNQAREDDVEMGVLER